MRTSLIIFGVIFLVIGGLLYYLPMQVFRADTTTADTTAGNGAVDTRSSSASVTVPVEWAFASAIIGIVLLILGLMIPDSIIRSDSRKDSYNKVVESKENIEVGDGNKRKITRQRTEKTEARKDDDSD